MKGEAPAVQKSVRVDAGKEACEVLIVNLWGRNGIKVGVLQQFDEVENVAFCQVVWEGLG